METWFESFVARNGEVSLAEFREMANEAQAALATTLNQSEAKETRQRADKSVRSVQEGRASRAGPRITTSLLGGDAEKLTAQIIRETGDVAINPKVKPLVDSLNRAGVPTKMSGDLYVQGVFSEGTQAYE